MQKKIALFLAMNLISNLSHCSDSGIDISHLSKKDLIPKEEVCCITCLSCSCIVYLFCLCSCPCSCSCLSRAKKDKDDETLRVFLNDFYVGYEPKNNKMD